MHTFLTAAMMMASSLTFAQPTSPTLGTSQPTILYGAAYNNEYMPADLQPGRLEKDVALMKSAGIIPQPFPPARNVQLCLCSGHRSAHRTLAISGQQITIAPWDVGS
ncbi:MAG TPA: hypothetical protein VIH89_01010 [Candidatus Sulfotelmatobacter sp.]